MAAAVRALVLHTCWENVDQETAGDDGILDNLMGFAGQFYILFFNS